MEVPDAGQPLMHCGT